MAAVRQNILASTAARDRFIEGVVALSAEDSGVTARDAFQFLQANGIRLAMRGTDQPLSTYDLFVLWHVVAMSLPMPPGNAAHGGPVFLPWHRLFLIRLEQQLQRVHGDPDIGLPYWDWAADGELPTTSQWRADLWTSNYIGQSRGTVGSGAIGDMRVRLYQDPRTGILWSDRPRPLFREAGLDPTNRRLPAQRDVQAALDENEYDRPPWSRSAAGHRNRLEGWRNGPQLHNLVHVWIGGDMSPGTSPNDPAFFLNHCNVDRIWEAWMANTGPEYRPTQNEGTVGHRIDDTMVAILGASMRPRDVLDPSQWYSYDTLSVA